MSRCARGTFHPTAGPTGLAIVKIDQSDTSPYVLCILITLWTSWRHGQETKPVSQPSVGKYRGHIKTLTTICSAKKLKPPAYLSVLCLVCLLAYSFLCHSIISLYASTFFSGSGPPQLVVFYLQTPDHYHQWQGKEMVITWQQKRREYYVKPGRNTPEEEDLYEYFPHQTPGSFMGKDPNSVDLL